MTSTPTPVAGLTTRPATGTNEHEDHGTPSWVFSKKCPCRICRDAKNAYQRQVYRFRGYGTWQPYIDATPTREHLNALHNDGISYLQIAEQSGLHYGHVRRIASGRTKQVRPETEAAVLGLTRDGMKRKVLPSTGSARRLQALLAVGWPLIHVAPHIGVNPNGVDRIMHQPYIFQATADAIVVAYAQLKDKKPEDHGVSLVGAQKSRALAKRRGWHDPLWWEDMGRIDDPTFDPTAAEQELNRNELAELRRDEVEHLLSFNCTTEEIAARLDMHVGTVRAIVAELRTGRRRDRGAAA